MPGTAADPAVAGLGPVGGELIDTTIERIVPGGDGIAHGGGLTLFVPMTAPGDEVRIQAYAAKISGSVGLKPTDDLDLFGPDGAPRPNLAPVMLAMSAVELGTLRASPDLVEAAIARLKPTP